MAPGAIEPTVICKSVSVPISKWNAHVILDFNGLMNACNEHVANRGTTGSPMQQRTTTLCSRLTHKSYSHATRILRNCSRLELLSHSPAGGASGAEPPSDTLRM